jgi:L-fuconolactonase
MAAKQKIIDTHNHLWKLKGEHFSWITEGMDVIRRDFSFVDLKKVLLENQVSGSILVQAIPTIEESEELLKIADDNELVKGVIGWCDIRKGAKVQQDIDHLRQSGSLLKGIRFMSQGLSAKHLLKPDFIEGCRTVGKNRLVYELLITANQLPEAIELVKQCPDVTFVIEHIAKPAIQKQEISLWQENMMKIAQASDKIYCKISGMVTEADWEKWQQKDFEPYIDSVYRAFGQDRIMFGSDWPVALVAAEYEQVVKILNKWLEKNIELDKNKLFYKNAENVYSLSADHV